MSKDKNSNANLFSVIREAQTERSANRDFGERESQILDAALRVFSRKGFDGSRTREIAVEAGVSEATIFKYFPSKRALLMSLLVPFVNSFIRPLIFDSIQKIVRNEANESIQTLISGIVLDRIELIRKNQAMISTLLMEALRNQELQEPIREILMPELVETLRKVMESATGRGELRNIEPLKLARTIMSLIMGYMLLSTLFPEFFKFGTDSEETDFIVDAFLHGFAGPNLHFKESKK